MMRWESHGGRRMRQPITLYQQSGSREESVGVLLVLHLMQSRTPAQGLVPPTVKAGLPTSVNRCAQGLSPR